MFFGTQFIMYAVNCNGQLANKSRKRIYIGFWLLGQWGTLQVLTCDTTQFGDPLNHHP